MSQEFCGCQTDIVQESFVKKICPDEFVEFNEIIKEHGVIFNRFAQEMNFNNNDVEGIGESEFDLMVENCGNLTLDEIRTTLSDAWKNLKRAFRQNTGGLTLGLVYHQAQERGEELDGYAWEVGRVWIKSKAGKKYADEIERISWVEIG
jgi:hypothetical protein